MLLPEWSLTIGEIVAPFGLAGEMKVKLETDFPERFAGLKEVCIRFSTGDARLYAVEGARRHKGQVLLKLRGITSINDLPVFRNAFVQVRAEDAVVLPANEFYIHDLVGCEVVTPDGTALGRVERVLTTEANDVYILGGGPRGEILLPAIRDVIRSVDTAGRRIVAAPTPGLLPDEAAAE